MIILDTYQKSLQISSTVAELEWTAHWVENTMDCQGICNSNSEIFKENQGLTTVGTVTEITPPTKNDNTKTYVKQVEYLSCYNPTANAAVINFIIDNNGTPKKLCSYILDAGSNATYNEDSGWKVLNKYGVPPTPITGDMIYITANGTDTYTASSSNIITYFEGLSFACKFINANTGPATLNINGLGAAPLKNFGGDPLYGAPNSDLKNGQIVDITYDGTNFQIKSVTDNIQNNV